MPVELVWEVISCSNPAVTDGTRVFESGTIFANDTLKSFQTVRHLIDRRLKVPEEDHETVYTINVASAVEVEIVDGKIKLSLLYACITTDDCSGILSDAEIEAELLVCERVEFSLYDPAYDHLTEGLTGLRV
ncbi:MAG: hypothetical protein ACRYGR_00130 [Janthinobacterium lividum]